MGSRRGKEKLHLKGPNGIKENNPMAADSSSAPPPPWIELPLNVLENILSRLGPREILGNAEEVCTTWSDVCGQPSMWRVIDMKYSDENHETFRSPHVICRRAIDLSQGELIDINIEYFGTNDLLEYVSEQSSRLKRLRLSFSCIYSECLIASVKNFPELEELHLFFMPYITEEHIEGISISCPMLKSFTFNKRSYRFAFFGIDDSCAFSIAKNMPNLEHLSLMGNKLSNEGLKAILNGCPKLESLDLRKCFGVDLGKICLERIKYLKRPSDPTNAYDWGNMFYVNGDYWTDSSNYQYVRDYDF